MVIVKNVGDFQRKNEDELKAFMIHKTGIYDPEMINDTLQEFYARLIQSKALESFDDKRAPTAKENQLNYEKWVCNNFCWLLPMLRKKNHRGMLKIKLSKEMLDRKKDQSVEELDDNDTDSNYEILRFYSIITVKEGDAEIPKSIFDVIHPSNQDASYAINERFNTSLIAQDENDRIEKILSSFFRYVRRTNSHKKAVQTENYMKYRLRGLNSVDIAILMGVSSNMVKFIKKESKELYTRWLKFQKTL